MKTLHIAGIAAAGVVGALLLGGGAFAAGSALGDSLRFERGHHGENRDGNDHQGLVGQRGEDPRAGFGPGFPDERGDHDCDHDDSTPDDTTAGPQRMGRGGPGGGPGGGSFASAG